MFMIINLLLVLIYECLTLITPVFLLRKEFPVVVARVLVSAEWKLTDLNIYHLLYHMVQIRVIKVLMEVQ